VLLLLVRLCAGPAAGRSGQVLSLPDSATTVGPAAAAAAGPGGHRVGWCWLLLVMMEAAEAPGFVLWAAIAAGGPSNTKICARWHKMVKSSGARDGPLAIRQPALCSSNAY
jgi:hypothetical protein